MTEGRTRSRMRFLAGLVLFMFAALTTRLWFLQVLAAPQFSKLAEQNQVRLVPIEPLRGRILDREGNVLVDNRPSTVVTVDRSRLGDQADQTLFRLSEVLKVPVDEILERLNSVKYLPYQPVPVAEDVPEEAIFYIEEHRDLFRGVDYILDSVRQYPEGKLAAHLLGYLGEVSPEQLRREPFKGYQPGNTVGKSGVEAIYERYLHGVNGTRELQVNAQGRVLDDNFNVRQPVPGDTLILSIDRRIQQLSERSLALGLDVAHGVYDEVSGRYLQATGGAVIVMNPKNGQVLALASSPSYDPAIFLGGLNGKEAATLDLGKPGDKEPPKPIHNNPLLNRAIQGVYPPGSTFKPFVALGSLREGFADPNGSYNCPGKYVAPGDTSGTEFHNWNPSDQGYISLPTSLVISCDTVYYQFGWRYWVRFYHSGQKTELMQRDLRSMGFGRPTGIDLPAESSAQVPTAAYKRALVESNPNVYGAYAGWLPGDYINMSIGQGYMTVTPLQLAMAYSALANGGTIFEPHVGWKVETPEGKLVRQIKPKALGRFPLSKKTVTFIRNSLTGVTASGTAAPAFVGFPLDRIPVAGKTGTADVVGKQPYSWFAALAPANDPKYVVVALVEQGGHGSTTAAPLVRRILDGLFGLTPARHLEAGSSVD